MQHFTFSAKHLARAEAKVSTAAGKLSRSQPGTDNYERTLLRLQDAQAKLDLIKQQREDFFGPKRYDALRAAYLAKIGT